MASKEAPTKSRRNPDVMRDKANRDKAALALSEVIFNLRNGTNVQVIVGPLQYFGNTNNMFMPINTVQVATVLSDGLLVVIHDGVLLKKRPDGSLGEIKAMYDSGQDPTTGKHASSIYLFGMIDSPFTGIPGIIIDPRFPGVPGVMLMQALSEVANSVNARGKQRMNPQTAFLTLYSQAITDTMAEGFVHEYTHYLDNSRISHDTWDKLGGSSNMTAVQYAKSGIEINAFYQQGIATIERILTILHEAGDTAQVKRILNDLPTFVDVIDSNTSKQFLNAKLRGPKLERNIMKRAALDFDRLRREFGLPTPKRVLPGPNAPDTEVYKVPSLGPSVITFDTTEEPGQPLAPKTIVPVTAIAPAVVEQGIVSSTPIGESAGSSGRTRKAKATITTMHHMNKGDLPVSIKGTFVTQGRDYSFIPDAGGQYTSRSIRRGPSDQKHIRMSISPDIEGVYGLSITLGA